MFKRIYMFYKEDFYVLKTGELKFVARLYLKNLGPFH